MNVKSVFIALSTGMLWAVPVVYADQTCDDNGNCVDSWSAPAESITCGSGYSLMGNTCVLSCQDGMHDNGGGSCVGDDPTSDIGYQSAIVPYQNNVAPPETFYQPSPSNDLEGSSDESTDIDNDTRSLALEGPMCGMICTCPNGSLKYMCGGTVDSCCGVKKPSPKPKAPPKR